LKVIQEQNIERRDEAPATTWTRKSIQADSPWLRCAIVLQSPVQIIGAASEVKVLYRNELEIFFTLNRDRNVVKLRSRALTV